MADLKPILAKLGRAKTHAQRFDEVAQEIFNRRPFELVGGEEEDGFAIRWKQNGEYPDFEPLSLIFGDMLYNLRATFDYLAWQLVLLNGEEPSRDTSFPCVRKSENWDNNTVKKQLKGIPPRWVDEIKQLQPFDARYTGAPETHPLAVLDEANNVNKHRMLPIALVTPRRVAYEISGVPPGVTKTEYMAGERVSDGALYSRLTFDQPIRVTITLDPNPVFRLRFSDITDFNWYNWDGCGSCEVMQCEAF